MEQYMETVVHLQSLQANLTWNVGFAVANGTEPSFKHLRNTYGEIQALIAKAKDLKAAYARR